VSFKSELRPTGIVPESANLLPLRGRRVFEDLDAWGTSMSAAPF